MDPDVQTHTRCFISAPLGAPLESLRESLASHGLEVLIPRNLAAGSDWASEIKKELSLADLVIGVLTGGHQSGWVLFELGQAFALGKRVLLLTTPDCEPIPFPVHQFLVLRIDLNNREAIDFALEQLLSAPRATEPVSRPHQKESSGIGPKTDELLEQLETSIRVSDWKALELVVASAVQLSGADVVVRSPGVDSGVDLAVWSDVLESFVGNPLLIEVKGTLRNRSDIQEVSWQFASQLLRSGAHWGLLLYAEGPPVQDPIWKGTPPTVLTYPIRTLIETLRTRSFPQIVRDLRNQRVHGVRP